MGSLFKAREAWSVKLEEEFDVGSLVISNVDNSTDSKGMSCKIYNSI